MKGECDVEICNDHTKNLMRIGINALVVGEKKTGIAYYTIELLKELIKYSECTFFIFVQNKDYFDCISKYTNVKFIEMPISKKGILSRLYAEQIKIPKFSDELSLDLIHSTAFTIPVWAKCKNIVTVHDMVYKVYPETLNKNRKWYYNFFFDMCIRKADSTICVSENTRYDVLKYLKVDPKITHTILEGVDAEKFNISNQTTSIIKRFDMLELPDKYILFVGSIEPRKNLITLIEAYKDLVELIEHKLVIVGAKGWKSSDLYEAINKFNLINKVIFTGYIEDELMPMIYSKADIFVFPSLYEGFGLPLLEAMACETPVITSNQSCLPEIVGDAAITVNPIKTKDLSSSIQLLLENKALTEELINKGRDRVRVLNWRTAAIKTMQLYKKTIEEKVDQG